MLERLVLPPWLKAGLALPLLVLNLWVLRQLLLPLAPFPALFVAAALIAFLLDIPSRWLRQRGLPFWLATAVVLGVALGLVSLAVIWLVPRLIEQLGELIAALPSWLVQGEEWLERLEHWGEQLGIPNDFGNLSSDIVLVLAVFLLLGGEPISAGLAQWLSPAIRPLVVSTLTRTFRGYFAGQVVLALILSSLQMLVFTLLGIPYGVLFAVLIGFTTLIPYASALTIVLVSLLLALEDPRTGLEVLAAAITVGQLVDQVIQPRLMGSIVGLQPAWLLISLPVGARLGSLLGLGELLGLLLAVPLASCAKTFLDAWGAQLRVEEVAALEVSSPEE